MPRWPITPPLTDAQRDALAPHVGVAYAIAADLTRGRLLPTAMRDAAYDAAEDAAMRAARMHRDGMGRTLPSLVGYCAAKDIRRAMGRAARATLPATDDLADVPAPPAWVAPDDADEHAAIRAAVDALSPRQRAVVVRLHGLDGRPEATLTEAAAQLGITLTPAHEARNRAYRAIRARLGADQPDRRS